LQAFDQLLLLKRGGETIYCGPLGLHSSMLISYFQVHHVTFMTQKEKTQKEETGDLALCSSCAGISVITKERAVLGCARYEAALSLVVALQSIPGVPALHQGGSQALTANPADWMLRISEPKSEDAIGVDFADIFRRSSACR